MTGDKKTTKELKNIHKGEDIYVLGASASMGFINPDFFKNKITISSNHLLKYFSVDYTVFKHKQYTEDLVENKKNTKFLIASEYDSGDPDFENNDHELIDYYFTHKNGKFVDLFKNFESNLNSVGEDDDLFVSHSIITSCLHLAAYMGAANIIVCGHDCGWLDGKSYFSDYGKRGEDFHKTKTAYNDYFKTWFKEVSKESEKLKTRLNLMYNCNIYSLNPFINFRMEGHEFKKEINEKDN